MNFKAREGDQKICGKIFQNDNETISNRYLVWIAKFSKVGKSCFKKVCCKLKRCKYSHLINFRTTKCSRTLHWHCFKSFEETEEPLKSLVEIGIKTFRIFNDRILKVPKIYLNVVFLGKEFQKRLQETCESTKMPEFFEVNLRHLSCKRA